MLVSTFYLQICLMCLFFKGVLPSQFVQVQQRRIKIHQNLGASTTRAVLPIGHGAHQSLVGVVTKPGSGQVCQSHLGKNGQPQDI